jgi:hypothetical protein
MQESLKNKICLVTFTSSPGYWRVWYSRFDLCHQNLIFADFDLTWMSSLPEKTVNSMLKSQQSKRSRLKGKVITLEVYRQLMNAAVCEAFIRHEFDKPKAHGGPHMGGSVEFSPEALEELRLDQDKLGKAIRNVQSKKSIEKGKDGFDPNSDKWQQLLIVEDQLKGLRPNAIKNVVANAQLKRILDTETDPVKALAAIKEIIAEIKDV